MNPEIPFRNLLTLLIVFSALADLVLGSLVLIDSPKRKINRLFSILCFNLSVLGIAFVSLSFSKTAPFIMAWNRLHVTALIFLPPLMYHLILGSLGTPFKGEGPIVNEFAFRVKQLAYVFSGCWIIFMAGGVFPQKGVQSSLVLAEFNQQFWIFTLAYVLISSFAGGLLFYNLQKSQDFNQKNRLLYLLIGATVTLGAGLCHSFLTGHITPNSAWFETFFHLLTTLSLILIAYALTTSQMYQFSELFRKSIAFGMMTIILLVVFGGTQLISNVLLVPYIPKSDYFALGVASITMSLLFHPLRFRVQNLVDQFFFRKRYDQMTQFRELSRRVLSSADREELLSILFQKLKDLGFGSVTLLLKDPKKSLYQIKKSFGLNEKSEGFFLKSDSLLIQYLREEKEELIKDEVLRRIMADWERQSLADEMSILDAEITFPLFSTRQRALFGLITLGSSELGNASFKGRNIFWLKSVIENAGIMLDNFYHHDFANALIPYVGRTWADEMRRNKDGFRERLAGYRTWVAVVMVDIRHFTAMCSRLDPREVVDLLKVFRSKIAPVVYRYQGTIDKFIGDAIMIVFGLPILPELENPDANAVNCARDISIEIDKMNEERFAQGKNERISIGMGISSGEVIAGNVDSGDRVEYTVIGDAANMVARLEDLAGDDQILMSPATYKKVEGKFKVIKWKPRDIAGFNEPITVYELDQSEVRVALMKNLNENKSSSVAANQ